MHYEVTELAMKSLNLAQVKALAALDGWQADKIVVHRDSPQFSKDNPDAFMMYAFIWRYKEKTDKPIYTIGILPDGSMHS